MCTYNIRLERKPAVTGRLCSNTTRTRLALAVSRLPPEAPTCIDFCDAAVMCVNCV